MLRSYKTEIDPTDEQKLKIRKTIGTCRFVYNFFIAHNKELHASGEKFMSGKAFSVWLNNELIPENQEYAWIKDVSSKSVKKAMEDADTAFQKFFKGKAGFPKFKKKGKSDPKMYFVKNNPGDCLCERHRVKIPTLGWVRLKEKGYIPTNLAIRSGTVSVHAGRYYVSVLVDVPDAEKQPCGGESIGIDFGIKALAVLSDGRVYPNVNKTARVKKLEKKLRREITINGDGREYQAYKLMTLTTGLKSDCGHGEGEEHTADCYTYAYAVNEKDRSGNYKVSLHFPH